MKKTYIVPSTMVSRVVLEKGLCAASPTPDTTKKVNVNVEVQDFQLDEVDIDLE